MFRLSVFLTPHSMIPPVSVLAVLGTRRSALIRCGWASPSSASNPAYESSTTCISPYLRETTWPADNILQQQVRFDTFVKGLNTDRPHEALGDTVCRRTLQRLLQGLPRSTGAWPTRFMTRRFW